MPDAPFSLSLDGEWRLDFFPQPAGGAVRALPLAAQRRHAGELSFHMGLADGAPFRKAAHMGGWDIFPSLLVSELWRGVALDVEPAVRLADVALAPEPGLIDIDYAVDGAAPERSHYLRGEPPFRRADVRRWLVSTRK